MPNLALAQVLINQFGNNGFPIVTGVAPGRVNLIGEHTDYNEGFVLPMAIDFSIQLAARLTEQQCIVIYSVDYDEKVCFPLNQPIVSDLEHPWSNYIRGVFWAIRESGIKLKGMEIAFGGNLPQGAGLSSSAALEVVTAVVLQSLICFELEQPRLAMLCQRAENEFVGMKCGIMDQFVTLMGKQGHALFLDCRTLEYQLIPLELGKYQIVICHSGVKHQLVASEYNRRRQDCHTGVHMLQAFNPEITALRDVDVKQLEQHQSDLPAEVYRHCYHIVSENQRVLESVIALRCGSLETFGQLMNESHNSQRDDFEVSCPEVDLLVDLARQIPGVLGARITGGGFGGCTVNLVDKDTVPIFQKKVCEQYQQMTGISPRMFICTPANGARII